jgi:hypothetical protein
MALDDLAVYLEMRLPEGWDEGCDLLVHEFGLRNLIGTCSLERLSHFDIDND